METESVEPIAVVDTTPMDTEPVAEPQPSKEILDQSMSSSLVLTNLEQVLQLSYPGELTQNPSEVELDLRRALPHQLVEKIKI